MKDGPWEKVSPLDLIDNRRGLLFSEKMSGERANEYFISFFSLIRSNGTFLSIVYFYGNDELRVQREPFESYILIYQVSDHKTILEIPKCSARKLKSTSRLEFLGKRNRR